MQPAAKYEQTNTHDYNISCLTPVGLILHNYNLYKEHKHDYNTHKALKNELWPYGLILTM